VVSPWCKQPVTRHQLGKGWERIFGLGNGACPGAVFKDLIHYWVDVGVLAHHFSCTREGSATGEAVA